jgi:hypothetical protein
MDPRRWAVAGFFDSMRIFLSFAASSLVSLSHVTKFESELKDRHQILGVSRYGVSKRFDPILGSSFLVVRKLHYLNNDLAALRFYALQNHPHYVSSEEIQQGKKILRYMEKCARSQPNVK